MSGFGPIGSTPIAVLGGAAAPTGYTPATGYIDYRGHTPTLTYNVPDVRVSGFAVEVLNSGLSSGFVTLFGLEVANKPETDARVSIFGLEVANNPATDAVVSGMYIEVLRSIEEFPITRRPHLLFASL